VGEIFDVKVPLSNYNFVKATVQLFGSRGKNPPVAAQDIEDATWEQLLLSLVAFSKNVTVTDQEIQDEITNMLQAENAGFDWKTDKAAYEGWLKEKVRVPATVFENQVRHLLQIDKLRNLVRDGMNPEIPETQARQEFMMDKSKLNLELVKFAEEKEADEFYKKVKGRFRVWEKEKKRNPKIFKRPGFVTLTYLNKLWSIPQDALEKMLEKDKDEIYPPRAMYKGWGIFKILEKKVADEAGFLQEKEGYYEKVRNRKKNEGLSEWIRQLKVQAKIKIYPKEGGKDEKSNLRDAGS